MVIKIERTIFIYNIKYTAKCQFGNSESILEAQPQAS